MAGIPLAQMITCSNNGTTGCWHPPCTMLNISKINPTNRTQPISELPSIWSFKLTLSAVVDLFNSNSSTVTSALKPMAINIPANTKLPTLKSVFECPNITRLVGEGKNRTDKII